MQLLTWFLLLLCGCTVQCFYQLTNLTFCKWIQLNKVAWNSFAKHSPWEHVVFASDVVATMKQSKPAKHASELQLDKDIQITNSIRDFRSDAKIKFIYFFSTNFGFIRFWANMDTQTTFYFQQVPLNSTDGVNFIYMTQAQSATNFSLLIDIWGSGYVMEMDQPIHQTNTFYIRKVDIRFTDDKRILFDFPQKFDQVENLWFLELTYVKGSFAAVHKSKMSFPVANNYQNRVVFKQQPTGFVFAGELFLFDTVRECVYRIPNIQSKIATTSSFFLEHHGVTFKHFFGCEIWNGNDDDQCLPTVDHFDDPTTTSTATASSQTGSKTTKATTTTTTTTTTEAPTTEYNPASWKNPTASPDFFPYDLLKIAGVIGIFLILMVIFCICCNDKEKKKRKYRPVFALKRTRGRGLVMMRTAAKKAVAISPTSTTSTISSST